ncbi:MAG: hypothetical protein ACI4XW_07165, partial [Candidatus Spyradocola sp.]
MMETEEIPGDKFGEIDDTVPVFVQKCSYCSTLNFTPDVNLRVKVCRGCHRARVASIEPMVYAEAPAAASADT